jgi:hypothetical protein
MALVRLTAGAVVLILVAGATHADEDKLREHARSLCVLVAFMTDPAVSQSKQKAEQVIEVCSGETPHQNFDLHRDIAYGPCRHRDGLHFNRDRMVQPDALAAAHTARTMTDGRRGLSDRARIAGRKRPSSAATGARNRWPRSGAATM